MILSSNFERVQIISGNKHNNSIVRCIDCTFDTGKIAASYDNYVAIYEPTPSAKKESHVKFKANSHAYDYDFKSLFFLEFIL